MEEGFTPRLGSGEPPVKTQVHQHLEAKCKEDRPKGPYCQLEEGRLKKIITLFISGLYPRPWRPHWKMAKTQEELRGKIQKIIAGVNEDLSVEIDSLMGRLENLHLNIKKIKDSSSYREIRLLQYYVVSKMRRYCWKDREEELKELLPFCQNAQHSLGIEDFMNFGVEVYESYKGMAGTSLTQKLRRTLQKKTPAGI